MPSDGHDGTSPDLTRILDEDPPWVPGIGFVRVREVVAIHHRLVTDFRAAPDPIEPAGLRDVNLLASAVGRQWIGGEGGLRYPGVVENAATLFYGLCANHAFHNGNKRTAFVSTLVHLNRNEFVLRGVSDNEVYGFLTAVAGHALKDKRGNAIRRSEEFARVTRWWRENTSRMRRGDRPITFRQLRQILRRYNCDLRNPHKNSIDIYAVATEKQYSFLGLSLRRRTSERRVLNVSYPGENAELSRQTLKKIREACGLTEDQGVDAAAFYDNEAIIDYFINHYRSLIQRLART